MKDNEAILELNNNLNSNVYPSFTEVLYLDDNGVNKWVTTISELPSLKDEGRINDSTSVRVEGMEEWKPLTYLLPKPRVPVVYDAKFRVVETPVDESIIEEWIKRRNQYEKGNNCDMVSRSDNPFRDIFGTGEGCIYFDPQTNIDIVCEVLRREAGSRSNVYLHLDIAHGSLVNRKTRLNHNLHLILTPARGHVDILSTERPEKGVEIAILSIIKYYLDHGDEYLFNRDGCMTFEGSLLFYGLLILQDNGHKKTYNIMEKINEERKESDRGNMIKLSQVLNGINKYYARDIHNPRLRQIQIQMLFKILKLYNSMEEVNDTSFEAGDEERERKEVYQKDPTINEYNKASWGITILYTNHDDRKKYFHLPLHEIEKNNGQVLLSQIIKYLKPLERLKHKFFMKHYSCRVDDEYYRNRRSSEGWRPTIYKPDLYSLTREISTPKEEAHKNCFINYFRVKQREREMVRSFLSRYPTLIDYYVWLESRGRINAYIDILTEHGEGSSELYKFIMNNH
jgi:hypothetical protein